MSSAEELRDWVKFVAAFANGAGEAMEDGKIDYLDAAKLFPAFLKLPAALSGSGEIKLAEIAPAEMVALCEEFKSEFDLPQDELEKKVEQAIDIACKLAGPMAQLKDFVQNIKAAKAAV